MAHRPLSPHTRYTAISTACATLILFQAIVHETVGVIVFPFAHEAMGGAGNFHALGIFGLVVGITLVWLTLTTRRWIKWFGVLAIGIGGGLVGYVGAVYERFHVFALAICVAGTVLVWADVKLDRIEGEAVRGD